MSRDLEIEPAALVATCLAGIALTGCGAGRELPAPPAATAAEAEKQAFVQELRPRRSRKPVIAILAINERTETTDFLLPHAVLQRAGIAEVHPVAPRRGQVTLFPTFQVEVREDLAAFDQAHPEGADYVIVPAMEPDDDRVATGWLRAQARKGAQVIGVCRGARVLGQAGLLDGRRFTGHWSDRDLLVRRHPGATHVPNQRYLIDRNVATSTGITASVPTMLALVEAIGGRAKAQELATELGVDSWSPAHDSARFGLDTRRRWTYLVNKATAFWGHQRWALDVRDGSDDVTLALVADAWERTGRVSVQAAASTSTVSLRSGLALITAPMPDDVPRVPLRAGLRPMQELDRTLCEIAARFGSSRHEWVLLEMEYAGGGEACRPGGWQASSIP